MVYRLYLLLLSFKNDPFLRRPILVHSHTFGLHCGVGVIDCAARQGYNVSVIMVLHER
jgi:uncharacterized membrane protein (DUF485 family)